MFIVNYLLKMMHVQIINKESYYVVEGKSCGRDEIYFFHFTFRSLMHISRRKVSTEQCHCEIKLNRLFLGAHK